MAGPDPVDVRLLSVLAELGNATVPDVAGRLGMDVRDVAARLAALSSTGLPLNITAECDQRGLRDAVAQAQAWSVLGTAQHGAPSPAGHPAGAGHPWAQPQHPGAPSGPHPPPPGSGPQPVPPGHPSGGYPVTPQVPSAQPGTGPPDPRGASGPQPLQHGPVHPANAWGPPASSAGWVRGSDSAPMTAGQPGSPGQPVGPGQPAGPSQPVGPGQPADPGQPGASGPNSGPVPPGAASTPQTATPHAASPPPDKHAPDLFALERTRPAMHPRHGAVGSKLEVSGPGGERLIIQLVEVVDPADYLFSAAGHELAPGQRAVVVHTELTNHGTAAYAGVPDEHLVLLANDGTAVSKSGLALTSRPPHTAGVHPGATMGGHTVYVLPESTDLAAVRWSPTAEQSWWTLTWDISDR